MDMSCDLVNGRSLPSSGQTRPALDDSIPAVREYPLMAGCCPPPRSPVRRLSKALRAFNTQRPWAPYRSGMNGRQGRPLSAATGGSTVGEAAVDDVVP